MKHIFYIAILFLMLSCNNSGKQEVKAPDFKVNDEMFRSELVTLPMERQKEIFMTLSPEMKHQLYEYKYTIDLASDKLTDKEKKYLTQFKNELCTIETFSNPEGISEEEQSNCIQSFKDNLGWSDDKIYIYSMTFMTADEIEKYIEDQSK